MELTEKAREMRNAYQRERYKQNKEKERNRMIRYWNNKAAAAEQAEHLARARAAQAASDELNGTSWHGRKSKAAAVQEWRQNNPEGRKADCRRETGLARDTIRKHWQQDEPQEVKRDLSTIDKIISFVDVQTLDDVNRQIETLQGFLDTLTAAEQKEWYTQNRATVDELMSLLEKYAQD